jgi:cell division protein FtsN
MKPQSETEPASAPQLFLQAGAFSHRSNAQQLRQRLLDAGLANAEIHQRPHDSLFRVRLGPYVQQETMLNDKQLLQNLGINTQVKSN